MDNVGKNPATRYGKNVRICSTVRSKFSNTIRQDMGTQAKINLQSYQIKKSPNKTRMVAIQMELSMDPTCFSFWWNHGINTNGNLLTKLSFMFCTLLHNNHPVKYVHLIEADHPVKDCLWLGRQVFNIEYPKEKKERVSNEENWSYRDSRGLFSNPNCLFCIFLSINQVFKIRFLESIVSSRYICDLKHTGISGVADPNYLSGFGSWFEFRPLAIPVVLKRLPQRPPPPPT